MRKSLFSPLFRRERLLLLISILLLIITFIYWISFQDFGPSDKPLKITAGDSSGIRHQFARLLNEEAQPFGVSLELAGTQGSEEALDLVNQGKLDLAFVQGGLRQNRPVSELSKEVLEDSVNIGRKTLSFRLHQFSKIPSKETFVGSKYPATRPGFIAMHRLLKRYYTLI